MFDFVVNSSCISSQIHTSMWPDPTVGRLAVLALEPSNFLPGYHSTDIYVKSEKYSKDGWHYSLN